MAGPEIIGKETPAGAGELDNLAMLTQAWLHANGSLSLGLPTKVRGLKDGLPIIDGGDIPRLEYVASNRAIRAIDPVAADTLGLSGPLSIVAYEEHYVFTGDTGLDEDDHLIHQEPALCFDFAKTLAGHEGSSDESLSVRQDSRTEELVSTRISEAVPGEEDSRNFMTSREFEALFSIVKGLDAIKAFDELLAIG